MATRRALKLMQVALALVAWRAVLVRADASYCGQLSTLTTCTNSSTCEYCAASYSCLPVNSSSAICPNECSICTFNASTTSCSARYPPVTPPPAGMDVVCANGGARAWGTTFPDPTDYPQTRFGGERCNCPAGWIGLDCSVCASNSTCAGTSQPQCNLGIVPTEAVPFRSASCSCTTSFCSGTMTFAPTVGTIKISTWIDNATSLASASVFLYKYVPLPADQPGATIRQSPVFAGLELGSCVITRGGCNAACSSGGCSSAPWSSSDTCDIWTCADATITCPSPAFNFWSSACTNSLFKAALAPPFSLACVLPASGSRTCSIGSALFSHGAIAMSCDIGQCAASLDDDAFTGSAAECDESCERSTIAALILVPLAVTFGLLVGCVALDRGSLRAEHVPQIGAIANDDSAADLAVVAATENPAYKPDVVEPPSTIVVDNLVLTIPLPARGWFSRVDADADDDPALPGSMPGKRVVLRGVSLYFGGRDMLAICGPSGSGKTSLLDVVAGRKSVGKVDGGLTVNGAPVIMAKQLRAAVGYVMQDDNLPGTSTVREVLLFHATMRMPDTTRAQRVERVNQVIAELGLGKAQATLIGDGVRRGVSGGERRRCSVGVEMVAGKRILLMDEPVSGLDSQSAEQVVQALARCASSFVCVVANARQHSLSASGKGVAISIHQPSSRIFHMFTMVAVLTRFGQLAYFGPSSRLAELLALLGKPVPAQYNPCEFVIDIVSIRAKHEVDALVAGYMSSDVWEDQAKKAEELKSVRLPPLVNWGASASFSRQVITLSSRFAINTKRHRILPFVHVVAMISFSLVASVLYWDAQLNLGGAINRAGFFFLCQTYLTLSALADMGVWQEERMVFIRERAAGAYGATAYLLSKLLCEVVALRLFPIVVACFIMVNCIGLVNTAASLSNMIGVFLFLSIDSVLLFLCIAFCIPRAGVGAFRSADCTRHGTDPSTDAGDSQLCCRRGEHVQPGALWLSAD